MGFLLLLIGGFLLFQLFSKSARADSPILADTQIVPLRSGKAVAVSPTSILTPSGAERVSFLGSPVSPTLVRVTQNEQIRLKAGDLFGGALGKEWKVLEIGPGEFVDRSIGGISPWPVGTEVFNIGNGRLMTLMDRGVGSTARYRWIEA